MIYFPFRYKLGIVMALLSAFVSGSSLFYLFHEWSRATWDQMGQRLEDIGRTATAYFTEDDIKALQSLRDRVTSSVEIKKDQFPLEEGEFAEPWDEELTESVHQTEEFQHVVQLLRRIKVGASSGLPARGSLEQIKNVEGSPALIRYAYAVVPVPGSNNEVVQFLADADYTEFDYNGDGEIDQSEEGTTAGSLMNIAGYAEMQESFSGKITADKEYTEDSFGVFLSGYIPVADKNGNVIAVIGLDMKADNELNMIREGFWLYLGLVVVSVLFSGSIAVFLAGLMTSPLETLRKGAERLRNKDFDTQINISTTDEIKLLADTFNDMAIELKLYAGTLEKQKHAFHRFVPSQFLYLLGRKNAIEIQIGDSKNMHMTVLFSDIRSFTTISETLTPEENLRFLNSYLQAMEPAINDYSGFVDKFIGDAIMALFINTSTALSSTNALHAANAMRRQLIEYNEGRELAGYAPVDMGIGLATGNVVMGTVGSMSRLDTTVIGHTVNVSSRIEALTRLYGLPILIGEETYSELSPVDKQTIREVDRVIVKGTTRSSVIYHSYGYESPEKIELYKRIEPIMHEGMSWYREGNFTGAKEKFHEAAVVFPEDPLAQIYLRRCEKLIENPPKGKWTGILKLGKID